MLTRQGTHTRAHPHTLAHAAKYVILIAFPQQHLFRERASVLRYTYIVCLVLYCLTLQNMAYVLQVLQQESQAKLQLPWPALQ